jgi:hypothetical protein
MTMDSPRRRNSLFLAFLLGAFSGSAHPAAASEEPGPVELPDRTVVGKKPSSRFEAIRQRSRAVLEFRPSVRARDPNVLAEFAGERLVPGAHVWMYPAGSGYPPPAMTDAQAHEGRFSLEVALKADAYSGGAVCSQSPLDLTPFMERGALEVWMKGAEGGEVFSIGLLDNGNNPLGRPLQIWVNSRSYAKVRGDSWTRVVVPLKVFGGRGSSWSEEQNARISGEMNWASISCFSVDIDKERHKRFKVWLDNARVLKVGPPSQAGGSGYPLSNEDFDDFPGSDP